MGCSQGMVVLAPEPPAPIVDDDALNKSETYELRRLIAFPIAFLVMWLFSATGAGKFILRTFFGMWLHEFGHASAAWLTGRWALPLPWVTFSFDRSWLVTIFIIAGGVALVRFGVMRRSMVTIVLGGALLLATLVGHLVSANAQRAFDVFGGEAGAMVYGALMSCGFLVHSRLRIFRGGLRWGWLVIGSASWADATRVWWDSRVDPAEIPFGVEDGMPSDASRLVDELGWEPMVMVKRFLAVAVISLLVAVVAFAFAALREWRAAKLSPPRSA